MKICFDANALISYVDFMIDGVDLVGKDVKEIIEISPPNSIYIHGSVLTESDPDGLLAIPFFLSADFAKYLPEIPVASKIRWPFSDYPKKGNRHKGGFSGFIDPRGETGQLSEAGLHMSGGFDPAAIQLDPNYNLLFAILNDYYVNNSGTHISLFLTRVPCSQIILSKIDLLKSSDSSFSLRSEIQNGLFPGKQMTDGDRIDTELLLSYCMLGEGILVTNDTNHFLKQSTLRRLRILFDKIGFDSYRILPPSEALKEIEKSTNYNKDAMRNKRKP